MDDHFLQFDGLEGTKLGVDGRSLEGVKSVQSVDHLFFNSVIKTKLLGMKMEKNKKNTFPKTVYLSSSEDCLA